MDDVSGFDSSAPVKNQQVTVTIDGNTTAFNVNIFASTYTVTFNSNGGTTVASQIANYNTATAVPAPPTKTGYTFGGWYTNAECQNAHDFSTLVTSDTTLYAKWTINNYTVIFNSQGGSTVSNKSVDYNNSITAPTAPTKTGYTFGGWYKEAGCINTWNFIADTVTTDTIIYAKWTINNYTAAFNSQGGSAVTSDTADYNNAITAPAAPTKTGYTFKGWYKEVTCLNVWDFITDKVTSDTTLYAKWTINNYTATFNSQGGSVVSNENADYNNAITAPVAPTKTGYTFSGWYKEATCINTWNFITDAVTTDTTIYAKWTINNYTATFNSQGGSAVSNINADYNNAITAPVAPTKTSYTFDGWYKEATCINAWNFISDTVTTDTTIYAKWTINNYTITFNSQGGSAVTSDTADYNNAITAPAAPTKTGYTFKGWYKEVTCLNVWDFITDKVTLDTTLYAKWTINNYTATFNSQGGSVVSNKNADYNNAITSPTAPTKTGYTFEGWYKEAGCLNAWNFTTDKVTLDTTLYAKWIAKPVTGVSLDKIEASLKVGETTTFIATVNPDDANNKNVTWSSSNDAIAIVDNTGKVAAVGKGTATITVTTLDGNIKATALINVVAPSLSYQGQVQNVGWQNWVTDGGTIGSVGQGLRLETLRLKLNDAPKGMKVKYRVQVQNIGWQDWKYDGDLAGTVGQSLRIETIQIELENAPGYSIQYRGQVQNVGWQNWTEDGAICGTVGMSLRLETLQIKLVKYDNNKAPESPTNLVSNNNTGSTINLKWDVVAGANSYNIYRSTDNVKYVPVGTAVNEISFTDSKLIPDTTYFYKVSAVNKVGEGNQTQSISVRTKSPSLSYQGQVENVGWQNWVTDGGTIGTVGLGLRLETLRLKLNDAPAGMKVKYRVQIQNIGWQDWKYDGDLEGTVGQSLRIETIQIELENAPGYSIQYRGQVQNIGWQSWTEDGAICGTVGFCCSNQIFF